MRCFAKIINPDYMGNKYHIGGSTLLKFRQGRELKKISGAIAVSFLLGGLALPKGEAAPADFEPPTAGELINEHQENREVEGIMLPTGKAEVNTPDERPQLDLPDELKVEVKGFKVTGQDIFPEEKLQAVLEPRKGKLLTFKELEDGADDLAAYFRDKGYVAVRVYLPVQKITNGIVEYAIVVGRFDQLTVINHTDIHDAAVNREVRCLKKGEYLTKEKLQRAIWLLSDLAGADAKATISEGSEPGTVHVEIDLNKHKGKQGLITVDNYGNRYTGYGELGVYYDFLNLAKEGDHFAVGGLLTGRNLYNYGLNYTIPILTDGLKLSAGYNVLRYHLGKEYDNLDGSGTARISSLGLDYAIRRSQKNNLYAGVRYDFSELKDEYRALHLTYAEKHGHALILSLYGDETDHYGSTYWRLDNKFGMVGFDSQLTEQWFAGSRTEGSYYKLRGSILRRQDLHQRSYLLLSARGQWSSTNLDSSEHISLGGFSGVRAYPQSEASGDCGIIARAELRWLLPLKQKDQQLQLAAYYDYGALRINKDAGTAVGSNYRHLQGIGLGLIWSRYEDWFIRADYAWRIDGEEPISDTSSSNGCFWLRGGVYF